MLIGGGTAHLDFDPLYNIEAFALTPPNFLTFSLCMLTICKKNWVDRITLRACKEMCLKNIFGKVSTFLGFSLTTPLKLFGIVLKLFFGGLYIIFYKNINFEKFRILKIRFLYRGRKSYLMTS